MPFTRIPHHRDLLSHTVIAEGKSPRIKHVVVFTYPDGVRTFDGKVWTATPNPPHNGIYPA